MENLAVFLGILTLSGDESCSNLLDCYLDKASSIILSKSPSLSPLNLEVLDRIVLFLVIPFPGDPCSYNSYYCLSRLLVEAELLLFFKSLYVDPLLLLNEPSAYLS